VKINYKNPLHLSVFILSWFGVLFAVMLRPIVYRHGNVKTIIFCGHALNGNILPFYKFLKTQPNYEPYYLSFDLSYMQKLKREGENPKHLLWGLSLKDMIKVAKADAIITTHGLHFLSLYKLTSIKLIDVWHGIPYKGWPKKNFKDLIRYDNMWVSSPTIKEKYIHMYDVPKKIMKITGYARVDQLVNNSINKESVIKRLNLPKSANYILLAPTWKQDDSGRNIFPFEMSDEEFFGAINNVAKETGNIAIFRNHLNSSGSFSLDQYSNIVQISAADFPIAEETLAISDLLVTDWSSIAFDFLALERPTIFLNVPAPFAAGFTLGPKYRFGPVVNNIDELCQEIKKYLGRTKKYQQDFQKKIKMVQEAAYADTLDGKTTERYFKQLITLLNDGT
jgi:CDP-glycerol glycerophosphotransferase (TagB/SpsB family)